MEGYTGLGPDVQADQDNCDRDTQVSGRENKAEGQKPVVLSAREQSAQKIYKIANEQFSGDADSQVRSTLRRIAGFVSIGKIQPSDLSGMEETVKAIEGLNASYPVKYPEMKMGEVDRAAGAIAGLDL